MTGRMLTCADGPKAGRAVNSASVLWSTRKGHRCFLVETVELAEPIEVPTYKPGVDLTAESEFRTKTTITYYAEKPDGKWYVVDQEVQL